MDRVIPDPTQPVYAAVAPWAEKDNSYYFSLLYSVGEAFGFEIKTPWNELSDEQRDVLLHGSQEPILIQADSRYRKGKAGYNRPFEGILPILERQLRMPAVKHSVRSWRSISSWWPVKPVGASGCDPRH